MKGEDFKFGYARAALMAAMSIAPFNLRFSRILSSSPSRPLPFLQPAFCVPIQDVQSQVDTAIACEPCNGRGWIVCDFCKGQKTNVKSENSRMFRRCPSCRAVGYVLCSKCKVFKCVTFPNYNDGEDLSF